HAALGGPPARARMPAGAAAAAEDRRRTESHGERHDRVRVGAGGARPGRLCRDRPDQPHGPDPACLRGAAGGLRGAGPARGSAPACHARRGGPGTGRVPRSAARPASDDDPARRRRGAAPGGGPRSAGDDDRLRRLPRALHTVLRGGSARARLEPPLIEASAASRSSPVSKARSALIPGVSGSSRRRPGGRGRGLWGPPAAAAPCAGLGLLLLWPFWKLSSHFEEIIFRQPSRLYAQPAELEVGRAYPPERILKELLGEGSREEESEAATLAPGRFRIAHGNLSVHLRSFFLPDGRRGSGLLEIRFQGPRVMRLWLNGQPQQQAVLEPAPPPPYY